MILSMCGSPILWSNYITFTPLAGFNPPFAKAVDLQNKKDGSALTNQATTCGLELERLEHKKKNMKSTNEQLQPK